MFLINPYILQASGSYLLDTYTTSALAHSVRLLSSTYLGSCLRVRRSSDNAEQDIGFSGGLLDETSLTSFVGANDAFVVKWYDQSGNSLDSAQSTASSQPQIVSGGTILKINGIPTIKSVSGDSLNESRTITVNSSYSIIFKVDTVVNSNVLFGGGTIRQRFLQGNTGKFAIDAGTDLNSTVNTDTLQRSAMLYFDSSTASQIWLSGILDTTGNAGGNATSPHSIFGGSDINIQEYIVWHSDYTSNAFNIHTEQQSYFGF
jgi:hypothetical protein